MTFVERSVEKSGLKINEDFFRFVTEEALPGTGIEESRFFAGLSDLIHDLGPKNRALLRERDAFQAKIDQYYRDNGVPVDLAAYEAFLREIGYIIAEGPAFSVTTANVDAEIATIAGPQLVVPVMNARFALNAANARWGSLSDALYGTDAIGSNAPAANEAFDPVRGTNVIAWARNFLNDSVKLSRPWQEVKSFRVDGGALVITMTSGEIARLGNPAQFVGYCGEPSAPQSLIFSNHDLHIRVVIDASHKIGATDPAHIADIVLESVITTIMDCEDSVAAVDAKDKIIVYRNWLGLMKGDLEEELVKGGKTISRRLNPDLGYASPSGQPKTLRARSLMLVRNVGHLMTNPAILDRDNLEVPEGLLDAMMTAMIALHDIGPQGRRQNSPMGSMYIVKPKMHGPEEVAFACEIFDRVEAVLGLASNTLKIGIMDEERRTTVNLKECIRVARQRIVFINTGFLDRTGDEIHTSMEAGPMLRKGDMKQSVWISAYEDWNVDIGLECGLPGRAQIGKGMWAMPDRMAAMLEQKIAHPIAGANTAWVPSPTAATLHATHYHRVLVSAVQKQLKARPRAKLSDILNIPVVTRPDWTAAEIQAELDNNAQGLLGYVVRWVHQGIGCSKVPDINNIGLMEDRATLRISSQHIVNWLYHGVVSKDQINETMARMARVVDRQNQGDPDYQPMAKDFAASIAFQAALELVFEGRFQPNGYTEAVLHRRRLQAKAFGRQSAQ